ncbi:AAA family ATPase, partial [Lactimicrobium sp.]
MRFIGREKETEDLMQVLSDDRQAAVLVYGRRRIGKSELIRHCLEQMNCRQVVFQCRQVTEAQNMQAFSEAIAYSLSMPGLSFLNLNDALKFLFAAAEKEKIIVVLDEYPFLRKQIEGCDSIIQAFLDAGLHTSKLKLILCGSYIDVMKSLLEYENPLYGRFSLVIKLNQMDYLVSSEFYQSYSNEDKVKMFSVFGGVPYYNSLIDTNLSADDNIIKLVLKENAPLQNEVDLYLRNEISKLENANSVFNAIAAGKTKFKDIYTASGLSTDASLNNMLTKLSEMEMITKEYPINKPNDKKKAVYRISDPLSDFYFRYIFRNPVRIQVMGPEVFFQRIVRKDFEEQYIP